MATKLWTWDEIENKLRLAAGRVDHTHEWQHVATHQNGVREYRSSRGHLALDVNAMLMADANRLMFEASEEYRDMAGPAS